ncbi:hypothetical protein [Rhizobium glycinendophyticum]|uniref:Uncharacterized protein n=1 Tax=Rhizobium glycinendophyticum TaxID=2589807 RepID=A0A504U4U7_9HYPH|nr:hypothetical protein [Rhizobium glycinendophyticum]TPP09479.1 hypothetical protein FJQ55_00970 [Rhizobium glycinendophyticum]
MVSEPSSSDPNPAQVRGDIQAGLTGEKQPGFDPAMAPLETDAEAGGFPLSPDQITTAVEGQRAGKRQEISGDDGSAMRPLFSGNQRRSGKGLWLIALLVLLLVIGGAGLLAAAYAG